MSIPFRSEPSNLASVASRKKKRKKKKKVRSSRPLLSKHHWNRQSHTHTLTHTGTEVAKNSLKTNIGSILSRRHQQPLSRTRSSKFIPWIPAEPPDMMFILTKHGISVRRRRPCGSGGESTSTHTHTMQTHRKRPDREEKSLAKQFPRETNRGGWVWFGVSTA